MLKVGMSDANLIGKVMTSLSASAKSDGSLSQLIATNLDRGQ